MISFKPLLSALTMILTACGDASAPANEPSRAPAANDATRASTQADVDESDGLSATLPARTAIGNLPCADVVLCEGFCAPADRAGIARCDSLASAAATSLARALSRCVEEAACGRDDACAQDRCAPQIAACVGDLHGKS